MLLYTFVVKVKVNSSKNKKTMSAATRRFLLNSPLMKYEIEIYEFAKMIFNKKLKLLGIHPK